MIVMRNEGLQPIPKENFAGRLAAGPYVFAKMWWKELQKLKI